MNVIPAHVAGVREIVMVVPTPDGVRNPLVLAAAHLAGVTRVFTIGGAQADRRARLWHATIPAVDKICGPGQCLCRRRQAPGVRHRRHRHGRGRLGNSRHCRRYGPSGLAGARPLCAGRARRDGAGDPAHARRGAARSRRGQRAAAHRGNAPRHNHCRVVRAPRRARPHARPGGGLRAGQPHRARASASLRSRTPMRCWPQIRHAGAIFVGHYSSESLGDYCAGPNHVLPTGRTARFGSPLSVTDFEKRSSVLRDLPRRRAEAGAVSRRRLPTAKDSRRMPARPKRGIDKL